MTSTGGSVETRNGQEKTPRPTKFIVGVALDFRDKPLEGNINLIVCPMLVDTSLKGEMPLMWSSGRQLLTEEPFFTSLNQTVRSAYKLGEKERRVGYFAWGDIANKLTEADRYQLGYSLLSLAEFDRKGKPKKLRQAIKNTANLILMSVGVRQWIDGRQQGAMEAKYNELGLSQVWGAALEEPAKFSPITIHEIIVEKMRDAKEVKISQDSEDLARMGEALYFMLRWVKEKNDGGTEIIVADPNMLGFEYNPDRFNHVILAVQ